MKERPLLPAELEQSLRRDPDLTERYERLWDLLDEGDATDHPRSVEDDWSAIEARIAGRSFAPGDPVKAFDTNPAGRVAEAVDRRPGPRPARIYRIDRRPRALKRAAAGAVVTLCLAALGLFLWHRPVTVGTVPGAQRTVALADGSTIHLNSASRITYRRGARSVRLEGEAFFDVASDPQHPFLVETRNARIEVPGTRFNVRSRLLEAAVETIVTLEEGRVLVQPAAGPSAVLDTVGAVLSVRGDCLPVLQRDQSLDRALAWRTNGFAAVDEPVRQILREVEIRFGVDVQVEGELEADEPMAVFYRSGATAEKIIHDICLARGWNYRKTSRGYAIYRDTAT